MELMYASAYNVLRPPTRKLGTADVSAAWIDGLTWLQCQRTIGQIWDFGAADAVGSLHCLTCCRAGSPPFGMSCQAVRRFVPPLAPCPTALLAATLCRRSRRTSMADPHLRGMRSSRIGWPLIFAAMCRWSKLNDASSFVEAASRPFDARETRHPPR